MTTQQKRIMVLVSTICELRDMAKLNLVRSNEILKDHHVGTNPQTELDMAALYELSATSRMLIKYLEETFDLTQVDKKVELGTTELVAITQLMKLSEEVKKTISSVSFATQ